MNRALAERLLAVPTQAPPAALREAYARRASELTREREQAITRSLRERIEQELATLRQARDLLLGAASSQADPRHADELPLTSPPELPTRAAPTPLPFSTTGNARVLDRYDLGEKLGSGGMGEVFAAFDRLTSQPVAIKFISERISSRSDALQRFLSEARLSCRLSHPNIVRTFDVHESAGRYFITMELLEGQSLRQHIASRIAAGRGYERAEIGRILQQTCAALAYAHKDLVHRDIKPENVWRSTDGTIKIMDFGVALDLAVAGVAEASAALGTEGYRAPEQTTGSDPVDQRADQYSVACMAVEMLHAPAPCRPAQVRADNLARRDPVRHVLERALAGRATDRYEHILDFEAALRRALVQSRWRRHLPALVVLGLLLVAGAVAWWLRETPTTMPAEAVTQSATLAPTLEAHARLSEARALLAALDTLVERAREDVQRLRAELASTEQRNNTGRSQATADKAQQIAALRLHVEDAETLAARASGWALLGDERVRVEGHLGAADAAVSNEQWPEAAEQAGLALQALKTSREQLGAIRAELEALRELSARITELQRRWGPAAPASRLDEWQRTQRSARDALRLGDLVQARKQREELLTAVQEQYDGLDGQLREHWRAEAETALRTGQLERARIALAKFAEHSGDSEVAAALRKQLLSLQQRAAQADADRRLREQEELELQREQESYRPRRGSGD